jgi:serine/threonine-protein kinase
VYVAFVNGQRQLYVREMSSGEIKPIPGTEGAHRPFFSPDGEWVGFFADRKLKKVALSGGTPIVLADAPLGLGGAWVPDDTIYFTPDEGKETFRIPAAGGEVQSATQKNVSTYIQMVSDVLPGGKAILTSESSAGVTVHTIETGERKTVIPIGWGARYISTGHLIYAQPGKLLAVPFDPEKLEIAGPSVTVIEGIQTSGFGDAQYAVSQSGLLAYIPGGHTNAGNFVWLDRRGKREPLGLPPGIFGGFALSPDGKKVAIPIIDEGKVDIWLYDTLRGTPTRFTFDGLSRMGPAWTPDGKKLVFISMRDGVGNIFVKPVAGSGEAVQLTKYKTITLNGRIPLDGKEMPIVILSAETSSRDIFLLPLDAETLSGKATAEPAPFLQTPFQEQFPTISPDGRWMAYYSNETGRWEIYVQPLEESGSRSAGAGRVRISTGGGEEPIWSRDGRELFYYWGSKIYVVDVTLGAKFRAGVPRVLFDGPFVNLPGWSFDVSPDGKRFLVVENEDLEKASSELVVITNFFDHVRRLTATGGD